MPKVSKEEREQRDSNETGLAILGRNIADCTMSGQPTSALLRDAAARRATELAQVDRATQFAALTRQIGDAVMSGSPTDKLVYRLVELRRHELR